MRESVESQPLAHLGLDLADISIAGKLVIVDLTDPLLSSLEANGIFQVLVEQFRAVPLRGCGKVLALDEAHKCMRGDGDGGGDGLWHAIVNCVRLDAARRHSGGGQNAESTRTGARAARARQCVRDAWVPLARLVQVPGAEAAPAGRGLRDGVDAVGRR